MTQTKTTRPTDDLIDQWTTLWLSGWGGPAPHPTPDEIEHQRAEWRALFAEAGR